MLWLALLAVEIVGDLAAELNLILVLLAEETCRVELEVIHEIKTIISSSIFGTWLKFLKAMVLGSCHEQILVNLSSVV